VYARLGQAFDERGERKKAAAQYTLAVQHDPTNPVPYRQLGFAAKERYKNAEAVGAQLSMDFLTGLTSNPAYELQLPYGTLTAARMNAVEDTSYPLDKLLNWCFDRGPLRGWGSIVGTWNGYPVSGLIGEANDNGNDYAFVMNGFQQAAALAPLPKYDKRYAKAIAKWLLNVTNASRLFYRDGLPAENQDSYEWSVANDPNAVIPHEALRQTLLGKSPYATGDAIKGGWAATNLSLYSGSSVGYLAAVTQTTNVAEILQIDLNKTDFYGENTFPSYLYFNPTTASQNVTVPVQSGPVAVYDAITESTLTASATNAYELTLPAGEVRLLRFYASDLVPQERSGQLYAGDAVLDYHYKYDFTSDLRIKSLSVSMNPVVAGATFTAYNEPGNVNAGDAIQYEWFINDNPVQGQQQASITAPATTGQAILKSRISYNGQTAEDTLHLKVVEKIVAPPVVSDITPVTDYTPAGGSTTFTAVITPTPGEILTYAWSANAGTLQSTTGNSVVWQAPAVPSVDTITVVVSNQELQSTTFKKAILVKAANLSEQDPLIWYPFDNDAHNVIADRFHAAVTDAVKTEDARGRADLAYRFTSGDQIILTPNVPELNFTDAISIGCWIKADQFGAERYVISHGSWQQRYKLSILPEGKLRWTIKTDQGIVDLDSKDAIELNRYYHVTAVYTGYSVELYVDGKLSSFKPFKGKLLTSTHPLSIGPEDEIEKQYSMMGSIDEVKIWDKEIPVTQIEKLKDQWYIPVGVDNLETSLRVYPNPAKDVLILEFPGSARPEQVSLFTSDGKKVKDYTVKGSPSSIQLNIPQPAESIYLLKIMMNDGKVITRKIVGK
jgi:hypothetical protein